MDINKKLKTTSKSSWNRIREQKLYTANYKVQSKSIKTSQQYSKAKRLWQKYTFNNCRASHNSNVQTRKQPKSSVRSAQTITPQLFFSFYPMYRHCQLDPIFLLLTIPAAVKDSNFTFLKTSFGFINPFMPEFSVVSLSSYDYIWIMYAIVILENQTDFFYFYYCSYP